MTLIYWLDSAENNSPLPSKIKPSLTVELYIYALKDMNMTRTIGVFRITISK